MIVTGENKANTTQCGHVRAAAHDLARVAACDFLPRVLHHNEPGVQRDTATRGLRKKRGHPLQHSQRLRVKLWIGRAGLLHVYRRRSVTTVSGPTPP
jgi:hypothetical protein